MIFGAMAKSPADLPPPRLMSWQVSDGCWALLLSMLAADPAARPSLARIAQNSWVRVGSPRELLRLNDDLLSKARCMQPTRAMSSVLEQGVH